MRRTSLLLTLVVMAPAAGCSVYDALFGMFGDNYSSASPDRPSRFIEMQDEVDRWEQQSCLNSIPDR